MIGINHSGQLFKGAKGPVPVNWIASSAWITLGYPHLRSCKVQRKTCSKPTTHQRRRSRANIRELFFCHWLAWSGNWSWSIQARPTQAMFIQANASNAKSGQANSSNAQPGQLKQCQARPTQAMFSQASRIDEGSRFIAHYGQKNRLSSLNRARPGLSPITPRIPARRGQSCPICQTKSWRALSHSQASLNLLLSGAN